jgi:hypothetical protein
VFNRSIFLLAIPLLLSVFSHLWNPIGFPAFFNDEGTYMRRAMHVLEGMSPQESINYYDHPYFGQVFLASVFKMIGYPDSLNPSAADGAVHSIEMLWLVPRVLMGILAVVDTFLVYKIAERRYNSRNVALIASILFAVMPITWLIRRVFLDNILLPFFLSSIFFAIYYFKDSKNNKCIPIVLLSGIFLGLAIFTKISIFTMIPLVGYLIYTNNKDLKILGLWLIPVILIPLIWPAYSLSIDQLDNWLKSVIYHTTQRRDRTIWDSITVIYKADLVLVVLAAAGFVFAAVRKDFFLLLWAIPFVFFFSIIGHMQLYYWAPLLPVFCIASASLIANLSSNRTSNKKLIQTKLLPFAVISAIGIFGLINTTMMITMNLNSSYFEAAAFVPQYIQNTSKNVAKNNNDNNDVTIISGSTYSWIFRYVFDEKHVFSNLYDFQPIQTKNVIVMVDGYYKNLLKQHEGNWIAKRLQRIYSNTTTTIATFKGKNLDYHYREYLSTNIKYAKRWSESSIDIRTS